MEPILLASSFASIVGLLVNYKSENRQKSNDEYNEFIEWLIKGQHEDVVKSIEQNQKLGISIKAILNENTSEIRERFTKLDSLLAQIATQIEGFSEIAKSVYPNIELSDQALSIVNQLVESGAEKIMEIKVMSGEPDAYKLISGSKGEIEYSEPRFIEDDLRSLVELGVLRLDYGGKGTRFFYVTRAAVKLINVKL